MKGGRRGRRGGWSGGVTSPNRKSYPQKAQPLHENTGQWKHVLSHILCSDGLICWMLWRKYYLWKILFVTLNSCTETEAAIQKCFEKKIISESFWECPKYYLRNNRETSSRSCQPTMTEVWRENSQWIKTIIYFYKIAPP